MITIQSEDIGGNGSSNGKSKVDNDEMQVLFLLLIVIILGSDIFIPPDLADNFRVPLTLVMAVLLMITIYLLGRLWSKRRYR